MSSLKLAVPSTNSDGLPLKRSGADGLRIKADPNFPLVLDNDAAKVYESFSILRSRLLNVHKRLGTRSVLVTSAEAADGKTLVAMNLALSLGQLGGKCILLVDGDLRLAEARRIVNTKDVPGIGDFLQGHKSFEAVVHPTEFATLFIAPAGGVPNKALPGILEGPLWSEFLSKAYDIFDIIILDSPPVSAPIADLELLARPCDAFLLVVRMRQTRREALKRVASRLDMKKLIGVVLNNADEIYDYDCGYYELRSQHHG